MSAQPKHLQLHDEVIIIAPAGCIRKGGLEVAITILEKWGLKVTVSHHALSQRNYFSGTDSQRLSDLQGALDSPKYSAIFCARGGYGLTRIIDQADFTKFRKNPKWIVGFSDITALHLALSREGYQSIHATMPTGFAHADELSIHHLKKVLFGDKIKLYSKPNTYNRAGTSKAPVIGGNLSLLSSSIGTKDEIQTDGKILFIEEIDEYLYKVDRMLGQLARAKKFIHLKGLIVGHMSTMKDTSIPFGKNTYELISDHIKSHDFPVLFDMPVGHEPLNLPIVQEGEYELIVTTSAESHSSCIRI